MTTDGPPVDLDFDPVEELSDEALVEQHRTIAEHIYENGYRPHLVDWHGEVARRTSETWREIKARADTGEPSCPSCGARDWGQVPGDPVECSECGYEAGRADERAVHDAWDAMFEEVGADA